MSRVQMLLAGRYIGIELTMHEEEVAEGVTFEFAHLEATFDLGYDVSLWLECAAHFFQVRFLRDEHQILATTAKCMDLRRFVPLTNHNDEGNYNDIKRPLQKILKWMKKEGVQDAQDIGVVFGEAMLLARNMEKDVKDFYKERKKVVTTPVKIAHREACTRGCANGPAFWGTVSPSSL